MNNLKLRIFCLLGVFTAIVCLMVSNDSPLRSINCHVDSAMFFMAGKAWANGFIPYIDFSDSKGPMLWFIEMVGYWMSPTNYHGVWVLSVIVMTITLYFCWLTAMAVLRRQRLSLCVAVTMSLIYFGSFTFLETRAETWCSLPVMYGIYIVVKLIVARGDGGKSTCIGRGESIGLGLAVMACLLIKWSVAVMMLSLCLSVLILCWGSRLRLLKALGWFCVGMVALALPFVAYFVSVGAFGAFVNEYFMMTVSTVSDASSLSLSESYYMEMRKIFYSPMNMMTILLSIIGPVFCLQSKNKFRWLLLFSYVIFFAIGSYRNYTFYYLQVTQSFALMGLIWIARRFKMVQMSKVIFTGYAIMILMMTGYVNSLWHVYNHDSDFHDVVAMDAAIKHEIIGWTDRSPRLLNYRNLDIGVGVSVHTLPANKYWFYQNGATTDMDVDQDDAVRERRADIIYTLSHQHNGFLEENGYRLIYQAADSTIGGRARLYMKKGEL